MGGSDERRWICRLGTGYLAAQSQPLDHCGCGFAGGVHGGARYKHRQCGLAHIAGNLGASNDESTWVLTSYLVSNAIVLPISGWLVGLLGRKRFFLICIVFFTVSSF